MELRPVRYNLEFFIILVGKNQLTRADITRDRSITILRRNKTLKCKNSGVLGEKHRWSYLEKSFIFAWFRNITWVYWFLSWLRERIRLRTRRPRPSLDQLFAHLSHQTRKWTKKGLGVFTKGVLPCRKQSSKTCPLPSWVPVFATLQKRFSWQKAQKAATNRQLKLGFKIWLLKTSKFYPYWRKWRRRTSEWSDPLDWCPHPRLFWKNHWFRLDTWMILMLMDSHTGISA